MVRSGWRRMKRKEEKTIENYFPLWNMNKKKMSFSICKEKVSRKCCKRRGKNHFWGIVDKKTLQMSDFHFSFSSSFFWLFCHLFSFSWFLCPKRQKNRYTIVIHSHTNSNAQRCPGLEKVESERKNKSGEKMTRRKESEKKIIHYSTLMSPFLSRTGLLYHFYRSYGVVRCGVYIYICTAIHTCVVYFYPYIRMVGHIAWVMATRTFPYTLDDSTYEPTTYIKREIRTHRYKMYWVQGNENVKVEEEEEERIKITRRMLKRAHAQHFIISHIAWILELINSGNI